MTSAVSRSVTRRGSSGGARGIAAVALFFATFAIVVAVVASSEGIRLTAPPLTTTIAHAIESDGTAAAVAEYRNLRARGFAGSYAVFGLIALWASISDVRMIASGGWKRTARLVRHLWRMCVTMIVTTMSFFLGQQHLFPEAIRGSALLAAPGLLVIAVIFSWLYHVRFGKTFSASAPARGAPPGTAF